MPDLDHSLLLLFNGSTSLFLDGLATSLTTATTWIPLYISLLYVVVKNNDRMAQIVLILAAAGLCVLLSGTLNDIFVKPAVMRPRPTHDAMIGYMVDVVDGYRGGPYGFFSSHAANTMSIAVFFCWLVRCRELSVTLVAWSLVNCWTRLYLGVHFPGDVAVGIVCGAVVGTLVWGLLYGLSQIKVAHRIFTDSKYTRTGYLRRDADVVVVTMTLTVAWCMARACMY